MSDKTNSRLLSLRQRAELALRSGKINIDKTIDQQLAEDDIKLVEEFRVYQAELEIQNEELSRSQLETHQALSRYRVLFKSLPIAALVLNPFGIIEDANEQAMELFGLSSTFKLVKHSIYRLMGEADRIGLLGVLRSDEISHTIIINDLKVKNRHNQVKTMNGHLIHLPLHYHLDNYTLFLLVDRSVETELKQQQVLQAMLDNSPAAIAAFDKQGRCLLANEAVFKSMSRSSEQVLGQPRELWLSEEETKKCQEKDDEVIVTGTAILEEDVFIVDNNKQVYLSNRFPLRDKDGEIFAVGVIKTDITAIQEIETRLHLAQQILSQGSEGTMICDVNNLIISVNKVFEQITGYKEVEVLGKNPSILSSGEQNKEFYEQMWQTLLTKNEWAGELYNHRKNGELYLQQLRIIRVLDDCNQLTHYIGIFNDISYRKW